MQRNIVRLSEEQSNNTNILTKAIRNLGEQGGHPTCCSGAQLDLEITAKSFEENSKEIVKRYYVDDEGNLKEE
jgi:hypothetical protein